MGAGLLGFAVALAAVAVALHGRAGLSNAVNVAALASFALGIPPLVVSLWSWWRRATTPAAPTSENIATAKDVLAGLIGQQWRTEATLRSLDDPAPIPVQWSVTRSVEMMDHPANFAPGSLTLGGSSSDVPALAREFRQLGRRRLVVLGGPGSGKTTLAVQLLLELLATRLEAGNETEPVPVLFSVADWDTGEFPRLHEWLGFRLQQDYPALRTRSLGTTMPAILAARRQIMPVLDGLDELPDSAQAAVITALNRCLSGDDQFIVTCRTLEYQRAVREARNVLTSAVLIEPQPLVPASAADYLERCLPHRPDPAWTRVLAGLRSTASLRPGPIVEVAATPLGVWLLRTVYITSDADVAPVLDAAQFPDGWTLLAHLLDQLIPALVRNRPPSEDPADPFRPRREYDPAKVRRWLGYLASYLTPAPGEDDSAGSRDFSWWRLARNTRALTPPAQHLFGLAAGLAYGLIGGLVFGLIFGPVTGFAAGLASGLAGGIMFGRAAGRSASELPSFADIRLRGRVSLLARRLSVCGVGGLLLGLVFGLAVSVVVGLKAGITGGLAYGLAGGLPYGLLRWAEAPTAADRANTPMTSWRADRTLNLLRIGALAGAVTLAGGFGLAAGFVYGLAYALVGGLAVGLMIGDHHAWGAYLIATHRLARAHVLPRRLMPFLDDAHRLGLLRAVGPIYQFRHAELQDRLAATFRPRPEP